MKTVWIAQISYDNGCNFYASESQKGLQEQVVEFCKTCWNVLPKSWDPAKEILTIPIPENNEEIIDLFFNWNAMTEEFFLEFYMEVNLED